MKRSRPDHLLLSALALASLVGCAKPPAPPPAPPAPAAVAAPPPPRVEAPDMSPVPAPASLVVRTSWKSPAASLKMLETIVERPLQSFVDEAIGDPEVAELLAFDGPAHSVVVRDPKGASSGGLPTGFGQVFSLPLKDFARARSYAERHANVEPVRAGVVRVRRGAGEKPMCSIAASVGVAPARLVCGDTDALVDAALPWLTRTAPLETSQSADILLSASGPAFWDGLQPFVPEMVNELQGHGARTPERTRWIEDGLQLLRESKQVDLALTLDRKDIRLSLGFEVSGKKSSFTKLLFSGKPTGLPPELARVPADATVLSFSSGLDAEVGRSLVRDLVTVVAAEPSGERLRKRLPEALSIVDRIPFFSPAFVVRSEVEGERLGRAEDQLARRLREERAAVGFTLAVVDTSASDLVKVVADALKLSTHLAADRKGKQPAPPVRLVPAPPGFPAGSRAVAFTSSHYNYSPSGKALPEKKQITTLVIVPHGSRTLLAMGVDTKTLASKARAFLDESTKVEGAAERNAQLTADFQGASAGFVLFPAAVGKAIAAAMSTSSPLRGTPNGGATPLPFVLRQEKDGARIVAELHVHEKSVTDGGALARFGLDLFQMAARSGSRRGELEAVPMP